MWVPRPSRVMAGSSLKQMKTIADDAVNSRRTAGAGDVPDLLDLLLEGEDPETGRAMSTAELRDNLLTFIVAGHETTALTLAWAFYLSAFDQERPRQGPQRGTGSFARPHSHRRRPAQSALLPHDH